MFEEDEVIERIKKLNKKLKCGKQIYYSGGPLSGQVPPCYVMGINSLNGDIYTRDKLGKWKKFNSGSGGGGGIDLDDLSITTIGTSGPATYNPTTGVFNIPNYTFAPTTPAGNNNSVQINNSGSFGYDVDFNYEGKSLIVGDAATPKTSSDKIVTDATVRCEGVNVSPIAGYKSGIVRNGNYSFFFVGYGTSYSQNIASVGNLDSSIKFLGNRYINIGAGIDSTVIDISTNFISQAGAIAAKDIVVCKLSPTYNITNSNTPIIYGTLYDPSLIAIGSSKHVAYKNTSGDIIHGNLSGVGDRMVVADSEGKLKSAPIPVPNTGTVTSVNAIGYGPINFTGGPVTSSGNLQLNFSGSNTKQILADGSTVDKITKTSQLTNDSNYVISTKYAVQDYTDLITFSGTTAPSGTVVAKWWGRRIGGDTMNLFISVNWDTEGSALTTVTFRLPTGAPLPFIPPGTQVYPGVIIYPANMLVSRANGSSMRSPGSAGPAIMTFNSDTSKYDITATFGATSIKVVLIQITYSTV